LFYLAGSIILTSFLTLSFKMIERFRIPVSQAIVFNYVTCIITGSILNGSFPVTNANMHQPWFLWAMLTGTIFISLFNVIGFSAQKLGVAITSVANKLSLVIPFLFSLYLYNEQATWLKIAGIAIAAVAVLLTCWPSKKGETSAHHHVPFLLMIFLPVVLFIGSGLLDTLVKYAEQRFLHQGNSDAYLVSSFTIAGILGLIVMLVAILSGKIKFHRGSIIAGIAIGIPNYFSIWCLVRVLKEYKGSSSVIIPVNNMGIVLFSSVAAWLLFKESLSLVNWFGIILSLGALALIAFA
jgi:drug/metabolite transporter (DMT)-like permease